MLSVTTISTTNKEINITITFFHNIILSIFFARILDSVVDEEGCGFTNLVQQHNINSAPGLLLQCCIINAAVDRKDDDLSECLTLFAYGSI